MTSVLLIAPLNAANFESGNASGGQVLTADDEGGAEWRTPAGGGGALFDDVAIVVGPQNGYVVPITVTFKLAGVVVDYPCAGIMIDTLMSSFSATNVLGGTMQRLLSLWILTTTAGEVTADLEVLELPTDAFLSVLTPQGSITTPVQVTWGEI